MTQALYRAICANDVATVKSLLTPDVILDWHCAHSPENGPETSLLEKSIINPEITKLLLTHSANPDYVSMTGKQTCLAKAVLRYLYSAPVHQEKIMRYIKLLLAFGANLNANYYDKCLFVVATYPTKNAQYYRNIYEMIEQIHHHSVKDNNNNNSILLFIIKTAKSDPSSSLLAKQLLSLFLHEAIFRSDFKTVQKILDINAVTFDPDALIEYLSDGRKITVAIVDKMARCIDKLYENSSIDKIAYDALITKLAHLPLSKHPDDNPELLRPFLCNVTTHLQQVSVNQIVAELQYSLGKLDVPVTNENIPAYFECTNPALMQARKDKYHVKHLIAFVQRDNFHQVFASCNENTISALCHAAIHELIDESIQNLCKSFLYSYERESKQNALIFQVNQHVRASTSTILMELNKVRKELADLKSTNVLLMQQNKESLQRFNEVNDKLDLILANMRLHTNQPPTEIESVRPSPNVRRS